MSYRVIVSSNEDGSVISLSKNNPQYGYIRVSQKRLVINKKGWVNMKELSALVQADVETLKQLDWKAGQELNGQIVIKESIEPFSPENSQKDLKIAGDSNVICSINGQPIYRKCFYDPTASDIDILVQHDNLEEIRNAMTAVKLAQADNFSL
jgi:hypothetical protein